MTGMRLEATTVAVLTLLVTGCQSYEFVFQPDALRRGAHLRFDVQQPSKADILFVIDNSNSMLEEQDSLKRAIEKLLVGLSEQDTSYRLAIVSTDFHGVPHDCVGVQNPREPIAAEFLGEVEARNGALGNCSRPDVELRRPHDGTRGRLMAAYDPEWLAMDVFDPDNPSLSAALGLDSAEQKTAFEAIRPASVDDMPWVIDREQIGADACTACGCADCADDSDPCVTDCADGAADALVTALFKSTVAGLGTGGFGWEAGVLSALWAVGVDPNEADDQAAQPGYDLTRPGGPNSIRRLDAAGVMQEQSWVRDDALLAILFLSDEEDCSMPGPLFDTRQIYEEESGMPLGSMCYQAVPKSGFHDVARAARLLAVKKTSKSQVAVGFIGGVAKGTLDGGAADRRNGSPADCSGTAAEVPETECSCLNGAQSVKDDTRWCDLTIRDDNPPARYCDAFAGYRYVQLAKQFERRTFESVCRTDAEGFGPAMADFAKIATLACFDLKDLTPADGKPEYIVVRYRTKDANPGDAMEILPRLEDAGGSQRGWSYASPETTGQYAQICLHGLDKLVGDHYEIFILFENMVSLVH